MVRIERIFKGFIRSIRLIRVPFKNEPQTFREVGDKTEPHAIQLPGR
jgi:hypothetical protein